MEHAGKGRLFSALKDAMVCNPTKHSYAEVAGEFDLGENAVKGIVYRLRRRFRGHLHEIIADTVDADTDIDDEIRHLFSVFSS